MQPSSHLENILAIRHFNRFYTKQFGLLRKRLLDSPYSLVEARVLYELAQKAPLTARDMAIDLDLDAGYLSRILKKFDENGVLARTRSEEDGRSQFLSLTEHGKREAKMMADRSNQEVGAMVNHLSGDMLGRMVGAMKTVEASLDTTPGGNRTAIIRSHRAGDIGWIISEHGRMYAEEYGFNENFEALVARIAADFISDYNPKCEHCWVAEVNGERVGSIFLVRDTDTVAKLRLLMLTPGARGMGLGRQLVEECLSFARRAGYESVELWTNAVLTTARHIYEKAGFRLISEQDHEDFGMPQTGQYWRLDF